MSALLVLLLASAATSPSVRAQPERLRLADGGQVRILVSLPGDGPLAAVASEGAVSAVPEGFLVRPGGSRAPRWLHVAVFRDEPGAQVSFVSVPLWGRATIPVRTDPGASVTALVAGEDYGPFVADEAGLASVAVDVPPGVTAGSTTAVAPDGAPVTRPLLLEVPAASRLHGVLVEEEPAADGTLRARLVLAWLGGAGAPQPGALRGRPSAGALADFEATGAGRYEAVLSVPPAEAGPVQVRVAVAGEPSALVISGRLEVVRAARLELTAQPPELVGGGATELKLRLVDSRGRGVPFAAPRLAVDGVAVPIEPVGRGSWKARLATLAVAERRELVLRASLEAAALAVELPLRLLPEPPVALTLTPERLALAADGTGALSLLLEVRGAAGPVLSPAPTVTASRGKVRLVPAGPGAFTLRFTPARRERPSEPATSVVRAELGALSVESRIELAPVARRATPFLRGGLGAGGPGPDGGGVPVAVRLGGGLPLKYFGDAAVLAELELSFHRGSPGSGGSTAEEAVGLLGWRRAFGPVELEAAAGGGVLSLDAARAGGSALVPALAGRLAGGWPLRTGALELSLGLSAPLAATPAASAAAGGLAASVVAGYRFDL